MKRIGLVLALAVALSLGFAGCKKAQANNGNSLEALKSRGVFVLGLDDSFPPMGFRDDDSNIVGYDIDLAKEVAARLGVEFEAKPIDWAAKEMELSTGTIDCIWNGFTMEPEREEALAFSKPYLENEQVLVVRADSGIETLADAAGKVIGLQSGSSAQMAVDKNPDFANSIKNVVYFKDNITALNDLFVGGIDGVVMDSVVAAYDISQSGRPLVIVDDVLSEEMYVVAFRKGDVELRDEVQKILEEMAADGTVEAITTEWFGSNISAIGN
ncbi:MAG: amino acid ABC transporter substrate-binding protein [Treponemataceae bacterium]|nr:amino acid ABC transporter substrate-binding protein [Treponemataceae bacterium]